MWATSSLSTDTRRSTGAIVDDADPAATAAAAEEEEEEEEEGEEGARRFFTTLSSESACRFVSPATVVCSPHRPCPCMRV